MNGFISFLWQVTVIILLTGISFAIIQHVLGSLFYQEIVVPYSQELNDNSDYLVDMLRQRTEQLYTLVDAKTNHVLLFDMRHSIFKSMDSELIDKSNHLILFTEQELNDFGYHKEDRSYQWLPIKYEIRKENANENN